MSPLPTRPDESFKRSKGFPNKKFKNSKRLLQNSCLKVSLLQPWCVNNTLVSDVVLAPRFHHRFYMSPLSLPGASTSPGYYFALNWIICLGRGSFGISRHFKVGWAAAARAGWGVGGAYWLLFSSSVPGTCTLVTSKLMCADTLPLHNCPHLFTAPPGRH